MLSTWDLDANISSVILLFLKACLRLGCGRPAVLQLILLFRDTKQMRRSARQAASSTLCEQQ